MEPKNQPTIDTSDVAKQKRRLRQECRRIRDELGAAMRQQASLSICGWIESFPVYQRSSVILAYMPIHGEVDLTSLMEAQPQKCWVLPRIIPAEDHRLAFHPYDSSRLVRHPFGMAEPAAELPIIPASEVQLALVPGLAFDRLGRRLGYGGGYFDRFLGFFTGVSMGVIFQALLFDQLPCGEHDVPMQWIITEEGYYQPTSP